jgi:hypothetical protein
MSPEQMFSLFAGFIAASFLIWVSTLIGKERHPKSEYKAVDHDPDNKQKSKSDGRMQESYWNVSTFFGLKN